MSYKNLYYKDFKCSKCNKITDADITSEKKAAFGKNIIVYLLCGECGKKTVSILSVSEYLKKIFKWKEEK